MKNSAIYRNKLFGTLFMIISLFAILVIFHRMGCYFYEFDPQFSPYDYGRFNFFSYFTVQSNIMIAVYLLVYSLSLLGVKNADKLVYNPYVTVFVTVYIIVTGAVYCCGIPLGFTPPFVWDTPVHAMSSFIQVFHHMIIPPLMIILLFVRKNTAVFRMKYVGLCGIYPLVYSVFSIIRGAVSNPPFYAYPFYNPMFVYGLFHHETVITDCAVNEIREGYFLMLPLLAVGILLFVIICVAVAVVYNKNVKEND